MEKKVVKQEMTLEDKKKVIAESGIVVGAILLLCYFFGFSYVWNTSYGSEAGMNGWNYIIAGFAYIFSGFKFNFKATNMVFGDMAVPFNYYAKIYVRVLSIAVVVSLIILLAYILVSALNIKKYHAKLELVSAILLYVLAAAFLTCIVVALTMNGSKILPGYCSNNPKCSIATLAFFPFFITLITAIVHSVFLYKNKESEVEV